MLIKGYHAGDLIFCTLAKNKEDARAKLMASAKWSHIDAVRFGCKAYKPSQVYAGMAYSTPHIELGLTIGGL